MPFSYQVALLKQEFFDSGRASLRNRGHQVSRNISRLLPYIAGMRIGSVLTILLIWLASNIPSFCSDLALVHAKIYRSPSAPPIEDGTILVHNGRIRAIGTSARTKMPRFGRAVTVLDCQGLVVTPGFWNSHVHILTPRLLPADRLTADELSSELERMFTRWGFTTVFDIASVLDNTLAVRQRIQNGSVRGPRILTVGDPFYPKGGTPIYVKRFLEEHRVPSAEVESTDQALRREKRQITKGADGIKIFSASFAGGGKVVDMPIDIAAAIVAEAHRAGKPVFAHPSNTDGLEIALDSGADILAHTAPLAGPWPQAFVARLKSARMALIPTLTLFETEGKRVGESPQETADTVATAIGQLKSYYDAGGQILFGTDAGYIEQYDTSEELTLMSRSGMNYQAILASLTTNPASRFGYANRSGRIATGMDADLVVLDGDPAKDVTAFSKVCRVIRTGKLIYLAR
jgi:imidazolonepropionase-like amidohydrolase